ncbi:MAG: ABC transporter substrate-binding protein [Pseudomonadota bacterium]
MQTRALLPLLLALLVGCGGAVPPQLDTSRSKPARVVSLDLCADQYVLKLVDRERILAVSPRATADFSFMRDEAEGLPTVRAVAEDVLVLKPDLVVRAYGGGPGAADFFKGAGIPVVTVGWASDIATVIEVIRSVAAGLSEPERGRQLIAEMKQRLEAIPAAAGKRSALYMTPSGVTTGPGSLVHEIMVAAGLSNFQLQSGWNPLPLERLAYETPELIAAAFFDSRTSHPDGWTPMRHPVAREALEGHSTVPIKGAWTSCAGWYLMNAVEALAAARTQETDDGSAARPEQ